MLNLCFDIKIVKAAVIVEPEIPENTGFIARLAANFDFEIRLVNPGFNLKEARETASGAQDRLREARIYESVEGAISDLDFVIGTKPGKGRELESFPARSGASVMIGRESSGLTNEELGKCDAVVHIEAEDYESLNQSHATAILAHHLTDTQGEIVEESQKQALDRFIDSDKLLELVMRSGPSRSEIDQVLGELGSEERSSD